MMLNEKTHGLIIVNVYIRMEQNGNQLVNTLYLWRLFFYTGRWYELFKSVCVEGEGGTL